MYSAQNVPLILMCIQNETQNEDWPLKELLTIILDSNNYAKFDAIHGSPLSVALEHLSFKSIDIMMNGDYGFAY